MPVKLAEPFHKKNTPVLNWNQQPPKQPQEDDGPGELQPRKPGGRAGKGTTVVNRDVPKIIAQDPNIRELLEEFP